MSTKPHVIEAFRKAGIETSSAKAYHGCAFVFPDDRYVAFFGSHEGWQIAKGTDPKGRKVVTEAQAVAWAVSGDWDGSGSACKQGFTVKEGVEKGRKAPEVTETQTSTAALQNVVVDGAKARKAKALLRLISGETLTKEEIADLIG